MITILGWVLPYIDMNQPQVHLYPLILKPHPPPSPPIPLGCPRALALSAHKVVFHTIMCISIFPPSRVSFLVISYWVLLVPVPVSFRG